jgi:hypothetical protein
MLINISDLALSIFLFIYENNLKMFLQVKLQHFLQSSALIWVVSRNVDSQVKIKYFNNNVNKNNLLVSGAPDEFISKTKYRTHLDLKWLYFF